ncbi:hypothetical protein [Halohasta salina]|uniref:hypothetical protein n=1 Tax=Halohasta salina TaxID=2961621 RepID=UPI0020A3E24E|nr:hypothetical protein [Halohasta salina]
MSWISDLIASSEPSLEDIQPEREERFPRHTYGTGRPIVIHQDELDDIHRLLEIERNAPDGWDKLPLLSREEFDQVVEDRTGHSVPSPEDRRDEIRAIIELWQEQISGTQDAVWTTTGTDTRFKFYIARCEARAEADDDDFEETAELETAREILDRIETAQGIDSKLAIVHKSDLPLKRPEENISESN